MKKHPTLIVFICFAAASISAADHRPNKRKYNEEKTSALQSVVKKIHVNSHALIIEATALVRDGADPDVHIYDQFQSLLGACVIRGC